MFVRSASSTIVAEAVRVLRARFTDSFTQPGKPTKGTEAGSNIRRMNNFDDPDVRVRHSDIAELIAIVALLESHVTAGDSHHAFTERLRRRLLQDGVLDGGADLAHVRLALVNLNQRLRYALGEYDEPVPLDDGRVNLHFGFTTQSDAIAFQDDVLAIGEQVIQLIPVDGRAYDQSFSWQVTIWSTHIPLTGDFDRHFQQLADRAVKHHGGRGGWDSQ